MKSVPAIQTTAGEGGVVISCAYGRNIPEEIRSQLPADAGARFVARIDGGRVVAFEKGRPEDVLVRMLGLEPGEKVSADCTDCSVPAGADSAPSP